MAPLNARAFGPTTESPLPAPKSPATGFSRLGRPPELGGDVEVLRSMDSLPTFKPQDAGADMDADTDEFGDGETPSSDIPGLGRPDAAATPGSRSSAATGFSRLGKTPSGPSDAETAFGLAGSAVKAGKGIAQGLERLSPATSFSDASRMSDKLLAGAEGPTSYGDVDPALYDVQQRGDSGKALGAFDIASGLGRIGQSLASEGTTGQKVAQGIQGGTQAYQGASALTGGAVPAIPGGPYLQTALSLLGAGVAGGPGGLASSAPQIGANLFGGVGGLAAGKAAFDAALAAGQTAAQASTAAAAQMGGAMSGAQAFYMFMGGDNIAGSIMSAFQDVPHDVREAQGQQRALSLGQTMHEEIGLATTPEELWEAIGRYQTGRDPGISLNVNSLAELMANPEAVSAAIQAGVDPASLGAANEALTRMIGGTAALLAAAQAGNPEAQAMLADRQQQRQDYIARGGAMMTPQYRGDLPYEAPPGGLGDAVYAGPQYDPQRPQSVPEIVMGLISGEWPGLRGLARGMTNRPDAERLLEVDPRLFEQYGVNPVIEATWGQDRPDGDAVSASYMENARIDPRDAAAIEAEIRRLYAERNRDTGGF